MFRGLSELESRFLVVECGVDWLTCTARPGMRARSLAAAAQHWLDERGQEGYEIKVWNWNGYRGNVVDGLSIGTRDDGTIVRLSGSMSLRHWMSAMTMADNVSRLDIQTTILDREAESDLARNGWLKLNEMPRILSGQLRGSLLVSTPTGSTLSIGSRSSSRYLRLYDKTAESDGEYPERCWRYEVEYKGPRARQVSGQLFTSRDTTAQVFGAVRAVFGDCGINVPGQAPSLGWHDAGYRHVTDDERRLRWVATCIRPVIRRLVEAYDAETVAAVLGFVVVTHVNDAMDISLDPLADDMEDGTM